MPKFLFDYYINLLPKYLQEKNSKFRRWQDRHSHLFGKLLLLGSLKEYGYSGDITDHISYNKYSRPYFDNQIDFNISHSEDYVIFAIGKGLRVGGRH